MKKDSLFNLSTYKNVKNTGVRQKYYIKNKNNYKYFQTKCNNEDKKISHINAFMPRKLIEQWEMKILLNFFAK